MTDKIVPSKDAPTNCECGDVLPFRTRSMLRKKRCYACDLKLRNKRELERKIAKNAAAKAAKATAQQGDGGQA